jgi:hypothetical protein
LAKSICQPYISNEASIASSPVISALHIQYKQHQISLICKIHKYFACNFLYQEIQPFAEFEMNLPPVQIILLLLLLVAFKLASSGTNDPNKDGASSSSHHGPNGDGASSSGSNVHNRGGGGQHCLWEGGMVKKQFYADYRAFRQTELDLLLFEDPIGKGTYGKVGELN